MRGFSPRTQESYLSAVIQLAKHYHQSPDQLTTDQLQAFFLYLVKQHKLSPASCCLYLNGISFTAYGCGLRVSERVSLKVDHIDAERRLLRIEQGKGHLVMLSKGLLQQLRLHWCLYHHNLQSTLRYVHWVPDYREGQGARDLISALGLPS